MYNRVEKRAKIWAGNAVRESLVGKQITEEDLRELIQKLEGVPGTKH
jgi:hypothetical protein